MTYFDALAERSAKESDDGDEPRDRATQDWQRQCRGFSLRTAIAMTAGLKHRADTGLEQEVSDEIERRSGLQFEGIAVPFEALAVRADWAGLDTRDVSTTTPAGGPGSRIVPTDYRPGDYIDLLRDALVTREAGIRVLQGLSGDVAIPKALAGVSAGWAAENADLATGDPSFAPQVTLSPNKVGAIGQFSARMILQASPDIEMLVRSDLAEGMARVIDQAVITGGGANEPDGVIETITNTARVGDTNAKRLRWRRSTRSNWRWIPRTSEWGSADADRPGGPQLGKAATQERRRGRVHLRGWPAARDSNGGVKHRPARYSRDRGERASSHLRELERLPARLLGRYRLARQPLRLRVRERRCAGAHHDFADVAFRHEEAFAYYDAITV